MSKGLLVRLHPACFSFLSAGQSGRMACAACGFRIVGVPSLGLWRHVFWGATRSPFRCAVPLSCD